MPLPTFRCRGKCQDQCSVVPMNAAEVRALQAAAGREFDVWPSPGLAQDAGRDFTITPPGSLRCPALDASGRCSGYAGRPMICRLYGMVEALRCPHGCEPSRWLDDHEAAELLGVAPPPPGVTLLDALAEVDRRRLRGPNHAEAR